MPVVNYQQYCKVLDSAKAGNYALPAINVSSALTANAAMQGFAFNIYFTSNIKLPFILHKRLSHVPIKVIYNIFFVRPRI